MRCPHCHVEFFEQLQVTHLTNDRDGHWTVGQSICPKCLRATIRLGRVPLESGQKEYQIVGYPRASLRAPCPVEVPDTIAEDYREACLVLADSPKAAAALGRRCLQYILRENAGVKPGDLAIEIQEVLDSGKLPSHLADSLDGVRHVGNFAAHPTKSKTTGEILPVELGEAEWTLDTLEGLFDFYFVQPARTQERRDALNKKLADAGKPAMR